MPWAEHHRAEKARRAYEKRCYGGVRFLAGWCPECGESFVVKDFKPQRLCSKRCQIRDNRRGQKARRRARLNGVATENIELPVLAERDGWRCHICKRKVTRKNWSVDHLVPISDGGADIYANAALAHHLCNASRGRHGSAQLRLEAAHIELHAPREVPTRSCEVCSLDYRPNSKRQLFCSTECRAEGARRREHARYEALSREERRTRFGGLKPRPVHQCEFCAKSFATYCAKWCSQACRQRARRQGRESSAAHARM